MGEIGLKASEGAEEGSEVPIGYYDLAHTINGKTIFEGTVLKTELHTLDYRHDSGKISTWYAVELTVKVDLVFAGEGIKQGQEVRMSTTPGKGDLDSQGKLGPEAYFQPEDNYVFMAFPMDSRVNPESPEVLSTIRESDLRDGWNKEFIARLDFKTYSNYAFPVEDEVISTPLEWATQYEPSYPLTEEQKAEMKERGRYPIGMLQSGRAYFTEEDFGKVLAFYLDFWPPGSSVQPMMAADHITSLRKIDPDAAAEVEANMRGNPDYWASIERYLEE